MMPPAPEAEQIEACSLCPRACGVPRTEAGGVGFCRMGALPVLGRAALHHWEEPCISGTRGSGTVFFSGCGLRCTYCQNAGLSHRGEGMAVTIPRLADIFRELEAQGAHNINLVTGTHFVPQILAALRLYRPGIPVVYNCGGYESLSTLRLLEGWVDIYLPDMKYAGPELAARYSAAPDYVAHNRAAVLEMCRQTGAPVYDAEGILQCGTLVRHLVLPGMAAQSMRVLNWIAEHLPPGTPVSLMAQYTPYGAALEDPLLRRPITRREYDLVTAHLRAIGLAEGYLQQRAARSEAFIPSFDGTGVTAETSPVF